jgi:head-tail adaptor
MPPTAISSRGELNAGMLGESVTVERATETVTSAGDVTRNWSILCARRANVFQTGGSEDQEGDGTVSRRTVTFELRWTKQILPKDRVVHRSRIFNIASIDHDTYRGVATVITAVQSGNEPSGTSPGGTPYTSALDGGEVTPVAGEP